jgi:hypothetical protein
MSWFEQKATLATHKLSNNWKDHCEKSLLWIVQDMKEEDILVTLYINTDQMWAVYTQGSNLTWTRMGSAQASVITKDEK